MKKNTLSIGILLSLMILINGCTLTRGSSVIVGKQRTPISASQVKLYTKAPAKYEEIAIVSADSRNDFASKQTLSTEAINRLKEEAAKVGANGVILQGIGDYTVGSSGMMFVPSSTGSYSTPVMMGSNVRTGKETKGMAIYVK